MSDDQSDDLSVFMGVSRRELMALAAGVKANSAKLQACPYHDFEPVAPADATLVAKLSARYRCRHCGGDVDSSAYHWHQQGRRPFPVVEDERASGYPCVGGPLDGRLLAHLGGTYHVSRWGGQVGEPLADADVMPPVETAEYRLQDRGGYLAWVFQGWPT